MKRALTPAEQSRVARCTPVARELALAMAHDWPSRLKEDLVAAALLRLTEIATEFDPRIQDDFWGFAYHHVRGAVLNAALALTNAEAREKALYRIAMREGHEISGEPETIDLVSDSTGAGHIVAKRALRDRAAGLLWGVLTQRAATPEEQLEVHEEHARAMACLRRAVDALPPRTQAMLDQIYREERTHEAAGASLTPPISSKQVQRIHKDARHVLASALEAEGILSSPVPCGEP